MLFPTVTFAAFLMVVVPLNWLTMPHPPRWRLVMILASYVFYAWWDPRFVLLLAGSTLFNQIVATRIDRAHGTQRRALLWVGVAGNVAILGYFKYLNFFLTSGQDLAHDLGIALDPGFVSIVLPVGISFYTFMALSYVIDVYRGDSAPVSLSRFALFLSFFPHLVAGPIVRPAELIPQFDARPDPRHVDATRAFSLIVGGLFLKVVLASTCAPYVDAVFGSPQLHSSLEVLVAIYAYAIQIFSDFAGYSTIAIGVALLLGFRFPDNFNGPYRATSLQDFWHRWHMTLSRWLRDYVYIPLGGNRKGSARTNRNLMLTMLVGGLWHGASWTFVIWGGLHGLGLALERRRAERRAADASTRVERPFLAWALTFNVVCLLWVVFRSPTVGDALEILGRLFTGWGQSSPSISLGVVAAIVAGMTIQFVPVSAWRDLQARLSRVPYVAQDAAFGVALMVVNALGASGVAPFIYFRF